MFPQNFSWGADNQEVDEETENPAAFQMDDDLGRQYWIILWAGLSDDSIGSAENTSNEPKSEPAKNSDLLTALQEKDNDIRMKADEIRRLGILNHDLESEV